MATFIQTKNPTPFGYYSSSPSFQRDADSVVTYVLRSLGEDVLGVELTKKMIWSQFEAATRKLNAFLIEYQNISNLSSLIGSPTGSIDGNGNNNLNLTNFNIQYNLGWITELSKPFAAYIGYGWGAESFSGSMRLTNSKQDYDMYTELKLDDGTLLYDLQPSGSTSPFIVYDVFQTMPLDYVYNQWNVGGNYVPNGATLQNYVGSRTNFTMFSLAEDTLRAGQMESAARIRRSHYSYRISGRKIRIYPTPTNVVEGCNDKVWLRIGFKQNPYGEMLQSIIASGSSGTFPSGSGSNALFGANSPFTTAYGPVNYDSLNLWAKNWIIEYTLALCKVLLGLVRNKVKSIPYPSGDLTLNGDDLVTQGREDLQRLEDAMKATLENLNTVKLLENEANRVEYLQRIQATIPIPPRWTISFF